MDIGNIDDDEYFEGLSKLYFYDLFYNAIINNVISTELKKWEI